MVKKENPKNEKGEVLRCLSCDSIRHMLPDCLDSWENLTKFRSMVFTAATVPTAVTAVEGEEELEQEVVCY